MFDIWEIVDALNSMYNYWQTTVNRSSGIGFLLIAVGVVLLFLSIYLVAKITSISFYIFDNLLRAVWIVVKNVVPPLIIIILYHSMMHSKIIEPEHVRLAAKGWLDMLWNVIT